MADPAPLGPVVLVRLLLVAATVPFLVVLGRLVRARSRRAAVVVVFVAGDERGEVVRALARGPLLGLAVVPGLALVFADEPEIPGPGRSGGVSR